MNSVTFQFLAFEFNLRFSFVKEKFPPSIKPYVKSVLNFPYPPWQKYQN